MKRRLSMIGRDVRVRYLRRRQFLWMAAPVTTHVGRPGASVSLNSIHDVSAVDLPYLTDGTGRLYTAVSRRLRYPYTAVTIAVAITPTAVTTSQNSEPSNVCLLPTQGDAGRLFAAAVPHTLILTAGIAIDEYRRVGKEER